MGRSRKLADLGSAYDGGSLSFRNRIINGAMEIDQRNAGAGASIGPFVSTDFRVDRFFFQRYNGTAVIYGARSSDAPPGFVKSLSAQVTTSHTPASDASSFIRQLIEGSNVADLAFGTASAKPVTLSFWVKTSLAGLHGGSITSGDFGRSYVFTYTVNSAGVWEYKTVTVPGDTAGTWATDNSAGMRVNFDLGSGSGLEKAAGSWGSTLGMRTSGCVRLVSTLNATFFITGVQLEAGSVATPFERRPYGAELALCQRYYEVVDGMQSIYGTAYGNFKYSSGISFTVRKRAQPTVTVTCTYSWPNNTPSNRTIYADTITQNSVTFIDEQNNNTLYNVTVTASAEI